MAKRQMRKQIYADRYRGRLSFGADASTTVYESFNTGMNVGRETAYKWTLLGATVGPANVDDVPTIASGGQFQAQLLIGTQTALVEVDDMQCISDVKLSNPLVTNGGAFQVFPLAFPILSPLPVFAQVITFAMKGANVAALNSKEWAYELWFMPTPTNETEMVEYLAAFGQV